MGNLKIALDLLVAHDFTPLLVACQADRLDLRIALLSALIQAGPL
jgi:hypothetical protein